MLFAALLGEQHIRVHAIAMLTGSCLLLFAGCMICHGELARSKPAPAYLTRFYLAVAFGGMLGGLFVGFAAPRIFSQYLELPLALMLCPAVYVLARIRSGSGWPRFAVALAPFAAVVFLALKIEPGLATARSFFGVVRIDERDTPAGKSTVMLHGSTIHGLQLQDPRLAGVPNSYFSSKSGAGLLLSHFKPGQPRAIGIVGLGAGTLAAYGKNGDRITFFEIDPLVLRFARRYFTWLERSPAQVDVVLGDGRLSLEAVPPGEFDLLIIDAFNSSSIPVHLLTIEAVQLYLSRIKADGVIALHITNRYLDLAAICERARRSLGLAGGIISSPGDEQALILPALYFLFARDAQSLNVSWLSAPVLRAAPASVAAPWSDLRNNLFEVMR